MGMQQKVFLGAPQTTPKTQNWKMDRGWTRMDADGKMMRNGRGFLAFGKPGHAVGKLWHRRRTVFRGGIIITRRGDVWTRFCS